MRFALSSLLLLFCFHANSKEQIAVRVAADIWCPYTCEAGERPGYLIEVMQKALSFQKIRVDYEVVNWARAVKEAGEGSYYAIAGASKDDAPNFVFPERAQMELFFELFTLKDKNWKFAGYEKGKKIGVINGYNYDEKSNEEIRKKNPDFVVVSGERGLNSLIPMLNMGRVDAILETKGVFFEGLRNLKIDSKMYKSIGTTSAPIPHFIAFSPKYADAKKIAALLVDGQKKLEKSGELKKIKQKYGLN
ncbi:MAG: substrate-binding periplasmic protein [Bdellovibrionia bacterium]